MDTNKNCSVCNIKLDINNYKKDRTVCKDCYNKKTIQAKMKLILLINNQKLKTVIIPLTIEHQF